MKDIILNINGIKNTNPHIASTSQPTKEKAANTSSDSTDNLSKAIDTYHRASMKYSEVTTELILAKYEISEGRPIDPSKRRNIEGINPSYISNMSDSEYLAALQKDGKRAVKESHEAYEKFKAAIKEGNPNFFPELPASPAFSAQEAKETLKVYSDALNSFITTRNQLFDYVRADATRDYLTTRFGEEDTKKQLSQISKIIESHDEGIKNLITSLEALYSFGGKAIASNSDGMWKSNAANGAYTGSGGVSYRFSIDEKGAISDNQGTAWSEQMHQSGLPHIDK